MHLSFGMTSATSQTEIERNKSMTRKIFDYFNRHDLDALGKAHSADHVFHFQGMPQSDWNGHRAMIESFFQAFPDLRLTIEDLIAEDDKVTVRFTVSGTNEGPFQGMPATGKKVNIDGIAIQRFTEGKRVEEWLVLDTMGIMQQLGAIPSKQ
jgi:steroid delta-isomerase-like uncharacterized protein